jgi:signal transduction histidine kinase
VIVVEWHGKPVFREGGALDFFYGLGVDITARLKSEEMMRRMNEELEAYAHAVSHDLRAPIANITTAAETLRRLLDVSGAGKEEVSEVISSIISSSRQAMNLIEETLRISRERALSPVVEEVDLTGIVAEVVREREEGLREKGVRVETDEDLGRLSAHRVDMYRIFSNLLDNAARFVPPGSGLVEIRRLARERDGTLRYLVRDNGPGIEPDRLEEIFEPFSRGEGGVTGVGLATVKLLVEAYGGYIRAYNDGGACFEFTLRPRGGRGHAA